MGVPAWERRTGEIRILSQQLDTGVGLDIASRHLTIQCKGGEGVTNKFFHQVLRYLGTGFSAKLEVPWRERQTLLLEEAMADQENHEPYDAR
jgi:hypothetical protein